MRSYVDESRLFVSLEVGRPPLQVGFASVGLGVDGDPLAPAAIAAEQLGREWIAIDAEPDARNAYLQRRATYLEGDEQTTLVDVAADGGRSVDTANDHSGGSD